MSIYFVQVGDDGPVKIGWAKDARKRVPIIQCANPARVRLLAIIEGGSDEERELHKRFRAFRVRGEWFSPSEELMKFISALPAAATSRKDARLKKLMDGDAAEVWFDPLIPTDYDAEKQAGIRRETLRAWLGPSGRNPRRMNAEEAKRRGAKGGRPPNDKPMTEAAMLRIWRRKLKASERAALIGLSVRQIYRWLEEIKARQNSGEQ